MHTMTAELEPLIDAACGGHATVHTSSGCSQQQHRRRSSGGGHGLMGASIEGWPVTMHSSPPGGPAAGPAGSSCSAGTGLASSGGFIHTRATGDSHGGCISGFSGAAGAAMGCTHSFEAATASLISQISSAADRP